MNTLRFNELAYNESVFFLRSLQKRLLILDGTVFFQPVPNTSFSMGLFIPDNYGRKTIGFEPDFEAKQFSPEYTEENCAQVIPLIRSLQLYLLFSLGIAVQDPSERPARF